MRNTRMEQKARIACASLTSDVCIELADDLELTIRKGTKLLVDLETSIAKYKRFHFDISPSEYTLSSHEKPICPNSYTTKDIKINTPNFCLWLPSGSKIYVDAEQLIAVHNGVHFDVSSDEFSHLT